MTATRIYTASAIFTGETWLTSHALFAENSRIKDIIPISSLSSSQQVEQFDQCIIAPAFIDLQVYGAENKLFAAFPDTDSLQKLNLHSKRGGTFYCLPTIATNKKEIFLLCMDAVREYWKQGGEGILGLHLEGPWINPEKRGAHVRELIHPPAAKEVKELLEYGKGVIRMITLAPEICCKEIIDLILSYDIIVSAGHSNANYAEAIIGFRNGITLVTHLFNAMSSFHHRAPGLVGAAMDDDKVMASIIPDGYHTDYTAIRIAKKVMKERLFAITDAVTETNEGYYKHKLTGDKFESEGILSGSALTMVHAFQNLVNHCGIGKEEALRMCSLYPARAIRMDLEAGRIEKGYQSKMIVLNDKLELVQLIE